jgi:arylamine N-acetyltransferase
VNIITFADGTKYMVDTGFGGDGPIQPLPLIHENITQNIGAQQLRLLLDRIPQQTTPTQGVDEAKKQWIYQYRNAVDHPWNSLYAFPEIEFFPEDFEMLNPWVNRSPQSFLTYRIVIVKFLRRKTPRVQDGLPSTDYEAIFGKVMLVNGEVKQNTGGRTAVVKNCKTEDERVEALSEHFGITLTEEERLSIRGRVTDLGAKTITAV